MKSCQMRYQIEIVAFCDHAVLLKRVSAFRALLSSTLAKTDNSDLLVKSFVEYNTAT